MSNTVRAGWNKACPKCGDDSHLDITALISVRLTPEGTDPDEARNHDHEWGEDSKCVCTTCDHAGKVKNFEVT